VSISSLANNSLNNSLKNLKCPSTIFRATSERRSSNPRGPIRRKITNTLDESYRQCTGPIALVTGVKPLIDVDDAVRWRTLAPRYGEFSVDSVHWWTELKKEPFHSIVALPWAVLLTAYMVCYGSFIMGVAVLLYLIGLVETNSIDPDASWDSCVSCAWQTVTTVGYGGIATTGGWSSFAGSSAVIISLVFDAVGIGIIYQKVSSPALKSGTILHSTCACICHEQPQRERPPMPAMPMRFECRVHHLSDYALVNASVTLCLARFHSGQDGEGRVCIEFQELHIGNRTGGQDTPFKAYLQYPFSVVHYIDEESPLAPYVGVTTDGRPTPADDFANDHLEIICMVLGTAAQTGSEFESRHSYTVHNICFGHRFQDALVHQRSDNTLSVDLSRFSKTLPEDPDNLLKPQCF